ncbi:MAG: DUF3794 domain-containing protein [Clostridiales bacterium]|nr:DUF3794 domain-containing protein [Clostridiales bacterium]
MELVKKNVHMTRSKGKSVTQLTLDNDFNVPDIKEDIDYIMKDKGEILIEYIQPMEGKALVRGRLEFKVLYASGEKDHFIHCIKEEIPFEEIINMEGLSEDDAISAYWEIEDLSTGIINSRKYNVKAIVTIVADVEYLYDEMIPIDIKGDETVQYMKCPMDITPIAIHKKDIHRIKDEIEISGNKQNISELLWSDAQLRSIETRPLEDKIQLRGEIYLFVLYLGEDESNSIQWSENTIPFNNLIECNGAREDMVPNITCHLSGKDPEVRTDYDGEMRVIGVDYVLEMDVKLYEEEQIDVVSDIYSATMDLESITKDMAYESLVMKNVSKCRTNDKLKISGNQPKILQICHSGGVVKVDDVRIVQDGLQIEGVVYASLLYITLDDKQPMHSIEGVLPFTHKIQVTDIDENCTYQLQNSLEQLNAVMLNGEEIELKAVIVLDALVLRTKKEPMLVDIKSKPYDMKKIQSMPGIIGYVVKTDDSLWKIAKNYYTTVDSIKYLNDLSDERIKPGDKLVLMKKVEEIDFNYNISEML